MKHYDIASHFDDPEAFDLGDESEETTRADRNSQARAAPRDRGLALTDAEREEATREANRILGVKHDYIVPGYRNKRTGALKLKEDPYSSAPDQVTEDGGACSKLDRIADARNAACGDVMISEVGVVGPTLDSFKCVAEISDIEVAALALANAFDDLAFEVGAVENQPVTKLHPLEQRIQRQDEARILRTRRLIVLALAPCDDADCYRATADECLHRLPRARGTEREILAAWAAASLRALGYGRAVAISKIAKAASCQADAVKRLIARGDAEIAAAEREAKQDAANPAKNAIKPDLREIEIGSVFDSEVSVQAIARLEADKQRRLMHAIEARFTRNAISTDDKRAEQTRLRSISFGMERRLDEIGRYDICTRTLLGRLNVETAERLVSIWVTVHADTLAGLPPDKNALAEYAGLLNEVIAQLEGQRRRPTETKQKRSVPAPRRKKAA